MNCKCQFHEIFTKKTLNILFTVHIVKFIRASLQSIKKLQTSTVPAETVNNFTDEL